VDGVVMLLCAVVAMPDFMVVIEEEAATTTTTRSRVKFVVRQVIRLFIGTNVLMLTKMVKKSMQTSPPPAIT
jgi:hypothetical protein